MAYQALYNKYRPQTFAQVVGQKAIVKTLENSLKEDKIGHGYLFCGPRGTGKTSMARLFAKALDCKEGVGHQCLKCESCLAVANGSHPDVVEIDAASNSGVDNVRDLITQVNYQPLMGRYKVYIIDECHNMTEPAFNALLKTLEEPPSYVLFILCTTEPQAILPTILSRVQRFDFGKVEDKDLGERVEEILKKEKVGYTSDAVKKIVELSDGGVRDALSILDQAVSFGGKKIDSKTLETLFGLLDIENKMKMVRLANEGKLSDLLLLARSFYDKGMDVVRVTKEIEGIYKDLIVRSFGGDDRLLKELSVTQADSLKNIGRREAEKDIQAFIKAERDFRYAQDLMDVFELALIKICTKEETAEEKEEEPKILRKVQESQTSKPSIVIPETDEIVEEEIRPLETKPRETKKEVKQQEEKIKPESSTVQAVAGEDKKAVKPSAKKAKTSVAFAAMSDDDLLNIMQQGDKALKKEVMGKWEMMEAEDSSENPFLSTLMLAQPVVVTPEIIIVTNDSPEVLNKLNDKSEKELYGKILKYNLDISPMVVGLTSKKFKEMVDEFKERTKNKTLPKKKALNSIAKENKSTITSADKFLDDLKGGL